MLFFLKEKNPSLKLIKLGVIIVCPIVWHHSIWDITRHKMRLTLSPPIFKEAVHKSRSEEKKKPTTLSWSKLYVFILRDTGSSPKRTTGPGMSEIWVNMVCCVPLSLLRLHHITLSSSDSWRLLLSWLTVDSLLITPKHKNSSICLPFWVVFLNSFRVT